MSKRIIRPQLPLSILPVLLLMVSSNFGFGPSIVRGAGSRGELPPEPHRAAYPGRGISVPDANEDASRTFLDRGDRATGGEGFWDRELAVGATQRTASLGWHQEAHDAQHTGFIDLDVAMPWRMAWQWNGSCSDGSDCRPGNPDQGWSFEVPPKSHLVAGDGRLYLPAGSHGVWAIKESDGRTAWHNDAIESSCTAAFDLDTSALFVAASDGKLYKLNSSSGAVIDTFQADSGLNVAPTIATGKVYVVSDNGTLYAVNKNTMGQVWSYSAGSFGQTPVAYSSRFDTLVFGTADLYLHAVNNVDGSRRWRVKPTVHDPPVYYYTNGWPVIADQHGIVLMRMRVQRSDAFTVPEGWETYPDTNSAIRSFLVNLPDKQSLFALNLGDGSTAFVPAVGPGGMETRDLDHSMGPQPVVKQYPNGDEVVYTIWRNRLNCIGFYADYPNRNYDGGMCEMVLDDATVPGYKAGDCRFVEFATQHEYPITVDEMGFVSMAGPTIMYSHWLVMVSYRITDRSDRLGNTRENAIRAERQDTILNRVEDNWRCSRDTSAHFCPGFTDSYCDSRTYPGGVFWVFWNCTDPPYRCSGGYSDGMKPRYTIANNGKIYYELNGGTIFAIEGDGSSEPVATVDKHVQPSACSNGDIITYTLNVVGNGEPLTLTDDLPAGLSVPHSFAHTLGTAKYDTDQRRITWTGTPGAWESVTIRFPVTVEVDGPLALFNTAFLRDSEGYVSTDRTAVIVDAYQSSLPSVMR